VTEALAVSDGAEIAFDVRGDGSAPPLVLVHSLGCDHHMWDHQVGMLSQTHRVVALDIRGHGASEAPLGDYTLERLARDVLDVADGLGIGTFDYCGLSVGGLVGQWLGINAADRVRSLTLCNTGARISDAARWNERIDIAQGVGMTGLVDGVIERWFAPDYADAHPDEIERARAQLLVTDPEGYAGCCAAIRDADLREAVHVIATRTLIVAGTRDVATPVELSDYLHTRISGSELTLLEAGHLSNVEQPDAFAAAVTGFLA
jgi:3-oxoadipate enol-lactonase